MERRLQVLQTMGHPRVLKVEVKAHPTQVMTTTMEATLQAEKEALT